MANKYNLFIISAPSGAGKSSLVKALLDKDEKIMVSISHTTREPRHNEEHGVNYHFVTIDEFTRMIEDDHMLEYAKVYNNYYGTSKLEIENKRLANDIILEIDWQGASQVKKLFPEAISIFITVASERVLEERLVGRATDSVEVIQSRMAIAKAEMSHASEFDFTVVNDNFDTALRELHGIIIKHRK